MLKPLKKIFPRALLTRMLLIIIVPTVLAQVISTYIFYNKHWDGMTRYIIYTLSNEISLIANTYANLPKQQAPKISKYTFLRYQFLPTLKVMPKPPAFLPDEIRILKTNMDYNLPGHTVNISFNKKSKEVEIEVGGVSGGALLFHINNKKIFVQSTYTFILWMIGSTLILLIITIIFAKNQIRSITHLSKIAGKLSKGQAVQRFIPHGATEVRNVGHAVLKMKQEIEDEVQRKSQMLAWVSHDLRTPLTRMKLQLALKESTAPKALGNRAKALHSDICEMEKIINDYLDFVKGETDIKLKQINLSNLVRAVIKTARIGNKSTFTLDIKPNIYAKVNENQFKRALFNLLDNAKKFGSQIKVKVQVEAQAHKRISIEIHDNGPGIPAGDMPNVFKPFYRSTKHGNVHGSGLGLPIVSNIIRRHSGNVSLSKSQEGGLMVLISLPALSIAKG